MSKAFTNWRDALFIVKPETVLRWHRDFASKRWGKREKPRGRPKVDLQIVKLIIRMVQENPLWGAPRIHGELLKLGFQVSERVVSKYMPRRSPSGDGGSWSTFLRNHSKAIISIDFFTVFGANFKQIRGFVILDHSRRKILHTGATYNNSPFWIRNQFANAFYGDCEYEYLICDNDKMYTPHLMQILEEDFGLKIKKTSLASPWQNAYVERVIGSIRRELLDHVIVFNDTHLCALLKEYQDYYNYHRTHLSLEKDTPITSPASYTRPGKVSRTTFLSGLHSSYKSA